MTGRQRVMNVLCGEGVDQLPIMPIIHTNLARQADMPLGRFFTDAPAMADAMVAGYRRFGFDGVQLTLGVTGEAEALGARVEQPPDGGPMLKQYLLADFAQLDTLRDRDPAGGGRMPMYQAAVRRVVDQIGDEAFVLSTLRGPLNIASQLRGVEDLLIDMLERPDDVERLLDFTTDVALAVSKASLASGAHALVYGEATCSPNFISPDLYRRLVQPRHARLIEGVNAMGWPFAGLHVCGNIRPIFADLIATGVQFLDVDYQVPVEEAVALSAGRVVLRGNLDPTSIFLQGSVEQVREATAAVVRAAAGARWIMSSGCDIPPGAPAGNLDAFVQSVLTGGA
ncbi:MAG: uroporphyrinogen decarboxylase family protein [Phycisphaerae bacterium]|nr:uroporphyrinogen decarboxylase family protein [Phycisphaerae bacterium]